MKKTVLLPNQIKKSNLSQNLVEIEMIQILTKKTILLSLRNQNTLILKYQGIKWDENSLGGGMIGLILVLLIVMKMMMKNLVEGKNDQLPKETKKRRNQILKKSLIA